MSYPALCCEDTESNFSTQCHYPVPVLGDAVPEKPVLEECVTRSWFLMPILNQN